jgi:hypothetical protein
MPKFDSKHSLERKTGEKIYNSPLVDLRGGYCIYLN